MYAQPCPTLCDPTDCSPPGSSIYGIFGARKMEWVVPPPGDFLDPEVECEFPVSCIERCVLYH